MRRRGVAASGAIGFAGAAVSSLLGFLLIAVVGRGLGEAQTGAFFQVVGWFMIVATLLRLGADTGLLRTWAIDVAGGDVVDLRRTLRIALVPVVAFSLLAAVLVQVLAPFLSDRVGGLDPDQATTMVRVLGWCLPATVVTTVLLAGLRGLGSVVAFTLLQSVAVPLLRVALALMVVGLGLGEVTGVLTAWAAPLPAVLVVAVALVVLRLRSLGAGPTTTPAPGATKAFWSFSLARGASALLETVLDWLDVLVVAALRSPAEAGTYAVVTRLVRAGLVVDTAVRLAVAPRVAALLASGDRAGTSVLFTAVARVVILVAWPAYLLLVVFGPTVLSWFGRGFADGAQVLVVLSVAMMVVLAAGIVQSLLLMGGRSHYQLGNKTVAVVVNLGLNLLLVPGLGIIGAAVAWAVTLAVDTGLAAWQVRYRLGVRLDPASLLLPAALAVGVVGAGSCVALALVGQSLAGLAVAVIVVGGGYAALVLRLRERLGLRELTSL